MKKTLTVIIACVLCALMVLPFAMMTSADTLDLTEPTVTATKKVYVSYGATGDGSSPDNLIKPSGWGSPNGALWNTVKDGGTLVAVGKMYFAATATFSATTSPVLITGVDGNNNYIGSVDGTTDVGAGYIDTADSNKVKFDETAGPNGIPDEQGTQTGMFMIANGCTMTVKCSLIFDNVTILDRSTYDANELNGKNLATVIKVVEGGKLVIGKDTVFAHSQNDKEYSKLNVAIKVETGAIAFIHKLGFSNCTGVGTVVVGDEILASVKAAGKDATFPNFTGAIVDKNGDPVFAAETTTAPETTAAPDTTAASDTTAAPDTTTAPETTKAPETTTAPETTKAPEKIEVPAKPNVSSNKVVYVAHDKNEAGTDIGKLEADGDTQPGDTPTYAYKTSAASKIDELFATGPLKDGGKIVIVGKFLVNPSAAAPANNKITLAATTAPVVITSTDGTTNYTSMKDGTIYYMNETGANAGQFGMFMLGESKEVTINCDLIFDDVVILSRQSKTSVEGGKAASKLIVNKTLTVTSSVKFANMSGEQNYDLVVNEGAYAYLDACGFKSITGKGTIVIGENLKKTVKAADFAGFDGYVVDEQGNFLFAANAGGNTNTGDYTVLVALAALCAVAAGAVLTLKKSRV